MAARFEIVRTDAGWFARLMSTANGKEVWRTSETYTRKVAARRAVIIARRLSYLDPEVDVDERTKP